MKQNNCNIINSNEDLKALREAIKYAKKFKAKNKKESQIKPATDKEVA